MAQLLILKEALAIEMKRAGDADLDRLRDGQSTTADADNEAARLGMAGSGGSESGDFGYGSSGSSGNLALADAQLSQMAAKPAGPDAATSPAENTRDSNGGIGGGEDGSADGWSKSAADEATNSCCGSDVLPGRSCCDPNTLPETAIPQMPTQPIGSGGLPPAGVGVLVEGSLLPADIGLSVDLRLDPLGNNHPIIDASINLGGVVGSILPNLDGVTDVIGALTSFGPVSDLLQPLGVNGVVATTSGVLDLVSLVGEDVAATLNPLHAGSALQEIGLQTANAVVEIASTGITTVAQTVSSTAAVVSDIADFTGLSDLGLLSAGGIVELSSAATDVSHQVNDLFNGVVHSDYGIALQSVTAAPTQALGTLIGDANGPIVETVNDVASDLVSEVSHIAAPDAVQLPPMLNIDELGARLPLI